MQAKITKYQVDKLTEGKTDQFLWDTDLKGFGLKCTPTGRKIYILQYRVGGRGSAKRYTIGAHGTWTPDTARKEAQRLLRDISQGTDPAHIKALKKQTPTLNVFAAQYLADYAELHKKPGSIQADRNNLRNHILPLLGSRP
ncbi:MAG: Arm DNA-binding domain-containing protein, partial [Nitrospirales bacterium]